MPLISILRWFGIAIICLAQTQEAPAQFAAFQVGNTYPAVAISYDLAANFGAACDGTTDDATALNSFSSTATTWQATHTGWIELKLPYGKSCCIKTVVGNSQNFTQGLKLFLLTGEEATLGDCGGAGVNLGGGTFAGISQVNANQWANINTVAAGATSVVITDVTRCSKWNVGDWATLAGGDLSGFGFPPTPYVWEYVKIASKATCASDGTITLVSPLVHSYKSTWPQYNTQDPPYLGGPATLYAYDNQYFDTEQIYRNVTFSQATQANNIGRNITYQNVTWSNVAGIPSQNLQWACHNCRFSQGIEFDKIIGTVTYENSTMTQLVLQTTGAEYLNVLNSNVSSTINGTAKNTTIANSTIANISPGAFSYGASGPLAINNSVVNGFSYDGVKAKDINLSYSMSGGVISIPSNRAISVAANNGSGAIRLTVSSTTGYVTGNEATVSGTGSGPCQGSAGGLFTITIIDMTHVDLVGSTFSATCTGTLQPGTSTVNPALWAQPGANVVWESASGLVGSVFQITDITQDANNTYVHTSLAGGFPTVPLSTSQLGVPNSAANIHVHPVPKYNGTGNTGVADIVDMNSVGAQGLPVGSYSLRTITSANGNPASPISLPAWGKLVGVNITVSTAYAGSTGTMHFDLGSPFVQTLGSASLSLWNTFEVNAKVASATPRFLGPISTSGAQSGDTLTSPPGGANAWLPSGQTQPVYSSIPGDFGATSTTVEVTTNQGVVYSPQRHFDESWLGLVTADDNAELRRASGW